MKAAILRFLKPALEANAYQISTAGTIAEAMKAHRCRSAGHCCARPWLAGWRRQGCDPGACASGPTCPSSYSSARDREAEKIEALDLGADDYVNKPFGVGDYWPACVLLCAIGCQRHAEIPILTVGDIEIDNVRHHVSRTGKKSNSRRRSLSCCHSLPVTLERS